MSITFLRIWVIILDSYIPLEFLMPNVSAVLLNDFHIQIKPQHILAEKICPPPSLIV